MTCLGFYVSNLVPFFKHLQGSIDVKWVRSNKAPADIEPQVHQAAVLECKAKL
jgi:hypothetical protein